VHTFAPNFKIVELSGGPYPTWEQFALPRAAKKEGCQLLHCTSNTGPVFSKVPLLTILHDIIYMESIMLFKKGGTWYQKLGNVYRRWVVPTVVRKSLRLLLYPISKNSALPIFSNSTTKS
jgi:hypothetical protein